MISASEHGQELSSKMRIAEAQDHFAHSGQVNLNLRFSLQNPPSIFPKDRPERERELAYQQKVKEEKRIRAARRLVYVT